MQCYDGFLYKFFLFYKLILSIDEQTKIPDRIFIFGQTHPKP